MIRRRRQTDRVVLDLGALDEAGSDATPSGGAGDPGGAAPPGGTAGGGRPASTPTRTRRIREAVAAGAVVVVALALWGTNAAVREHQRVQRLLTAPGGVLSLAQAPTERWTAPTDSADATAFLPGLVVVRRGTVLHGLDAGTGADRWQVEVGGDPVCGPSATNHGDLAATDPLVCWSGPNAARSTVTVVHADGTAVTRDLDAAEAVAPTADGGLATAWRVGPTPPDPGVEALATESGGYRLQGSVPQGQDVTVRLEDAATGALRWERTAAFRPVADVNSCTTVNVDFSENRPRVDLSALSLTAYPGLVVVQACGVQAAFDADGRTAADPGSSAWSEAEPYLDGGVLEQVAGYTDDTSVASVLHAPDGAGVTTFPNQVLQPWATDGTPSDLVLAGSAGVPLQGLGRDGTVRWHSDHTFGQVLVRTRGVVLAERGDQAITALDPRTGAELWTDAGVLPEGAVATGADTVVGAFTDGAVAALVLRPGGEGAAELVALDLATGALRWRTTLSADWPLLYAAQGRLVHVTQSGDTWVRPGEDGLWVRHADGTVAVLG